MAAPQEIRSAVGGDYRSLNRRPTALGIERKLCVGIGIVVVCYFQLSDEFLRSLCLFAALWGIAFSLETWEPRILNMLPDLWRQRAVYCPRKFVG